MAARGVATGAWRAIFSEGNRWYQNISFQGHRTDQTLQRKGVKINFT